MKRDSLSEEKINAFLGKTAVSFSVFAYDEISSTNDVCKDFARKGAESGIVVIAKSQTAGRGRLGRTFYSPANHGLYMSLLIRPDKEFNNPGLITAYAAVSCYKAISTLYGISVDIKWVNDLYYHNKKLCGILAESQLGTDNPYIILGIGINLSPPAEGYNKDIKDIAISLEEMTNHPVIREELCAEICRNLFFDDIQALQNRDFMDTYRSASCVIGNMVRFTENGTQMTAHAVSIDDDANLIIRTEDGKERTLFAGEITLLRQL